MKKLLFVLILLPSFAFCQEFKIEHKRNDDKSVSFRYQKSKPNSVTAILEFSFMSNTSSPRTIIQKLAKSQGSFITLKPTNPDENIGFNYTYKYFNQTINPTLDEDFVYILPYKKGTKMNVEELDYLGKKYSNKKKPKGWKAYSFKSNVSQEIYPSSLFGLGCVSKIPVRKFFKTSNALPVTKWSLAVSMCFKSFILLVSRETLSAHVNQ